MSANAKIAKTTPEYFYKYRSLCGKDRERTLLSIVHGIIWFSSPKNFADENDCQIPVSYEATPDEFRAFAESALSAVMPHLTEEQRSALIEDRIQSGVHVESERIDSFRESQQEQITERGVLSLCSTNVSEGMWQDYADKHRGCCWEFKRSDRGMFANAEEVRYEKELPTVNPFKAPHVEVNNVIMLTKAEKFGFEHEWRIWDLRGPGYWKYNPGDLTGLIFGYLTPKEDRSLLAYLMNRSHPTARIFESIKTEEGLQIIPWTA